ncbi:MAG: hybrid sensor histidine kinase/response regulator, partial [Deltaproteobacteria bacterium]|nr:hybrid sensor histidine kinase/response regulator [Deltaproteobacteria bacterium]
EQAPDILVADVGMPGMDGFELTREFRALPGNRLAPVILLPAYGGLKDRLEGLDAGAVDYVLKPYDPDELLARIRNQLAQRNLALKLHESESLASLGMLSAGLAHEMRNPANALVNAVQPLRRMLPPQYTEPNGPTGQLLGVIQDCAAQIGRLSRDLLGLGKPAMASGQPERIGKIVDKSLVVAQPFLQDVKVRKKLDYDGSLHCSAGLVVQALVNLLENGAHAAGPDGWVEVRANLQGDRVHIEVQDSGPGVPRDLRQKIFDPFFTTKNPGRGTGLGLPTSRTIAIQHGGDLVLLEGSGGAVFRLDLPVAGPPQVTALAAGQSSISRSAVS